MVEGAAPAGGLGGTKGGPLGETVRDIYFTFKKAAETLKTKGYDLLDIGARSFDQDYADFKQVEANAVGLKALNNKSISVFETPSMSAQIHFSACERKSDICLSIDLMRVCW